MDSILTVNLRVLMMVLFLLLGGGAIVNIAVAWGCVLLVDVPGWYESVARGYATAIFAEAGPQTLWEGYYARRIGHVRCGIRLVERERWPGYRGPVGPPVPAWSAARGVDVAEERADAVQSFRRFYEDDASGYPCLALQTRSVRRTEGGGEYQPDGPHWGIRIREPKSNDDLALALPLLPIWPGFAINTVMYGAILWLLFVVPFALRRRRRIRRGLCPKCAYPVGPSAVCTECGAVVIRHTAETQKA